MSVFPFFSIIIVCLNAENLITPTIDSIRTQTYDDYEVIVKDGRSKDKTLSRIPADKRYRTYSEADSSIYDAMNQATHYSKGKYLIYMNCGDVFASDTVLQSVHDAIAEGKFGFVYGDYIRDEIVHCQAKVLTSFYLYRTPLCHQTIFFDGDVLRSMAPYDVQYKVLADYDLELRIYKQLQMRVLHMDISVCRYLGGGYSETEKGVQLKRVERRYILERYFSRATRWKYQLMRSMSMPKLRNKIVGKGPKWLKKTYQWFVNRVNSGWNK